VITSWSAGVADENMDESILLELAELIACHPWWAARGRLMLDLLQRVAVLAPARILEVGCGWGTNLTLLEKAGYDVTGLDISRRALTKLDRTDRRLVEADLTKDLPANAPEFDAVLALDVIEHIEDDRAAVLRLFQLVKPDGYVIVSVPALPGLYSEFDRVQGHRRRYTRERVTEAFVGTGLEIEDVLWWGQWMARILDRRKVMNRARQEDTSVQVYKRYLSLPPWPGTLVMKAMFMIDHRRTLRRRNATGTSLFVIARRPRK
jgi:2-polyprenyl-3-methyl-5-hydroxy-6-metoxy-1,4-benzoquinol methylase